MADKKTDKKVKAILRDKELDQTSGGCNPDYVTGKYDPSGANAAIPKNPKANPFI